MIEAIVFGGVAAIWAFMEIQWLLDERWAESVHLPLVCNALAEVEADEERWA